jgi:hypothetical protein
MEHAAECFCDTRARNPAYGWAGECQVRFGTYPVQVADEWNTAVHVQAAESIAAERLQAAASISR